MLQELRAVEQHGSGPTGGGPGPGSDLLVSAVQLHFLPGVEEQEPAGVGEQQPVALRRSVDELRRHLPGISAVQPLQHRAGAAR